MVLKKNGSPPDSSYTTIDYILTQTPVIDEVWDKYLSWAKQHKKSWSKDLQRWQMHVQPHLRGKKMDAIMTYDLHFVIKMTRSKGTYAPATIKHVIGLIKKGLQLCW